MAKDVGIRPPTGRIEKTVRRGVEPQSQTFMAFTAPFQYTAADQQVLTSLSEVLSNRLTEKLREKLGGTYGVGARLSGTRDDPQIVTATISFGSAPERAEELTQAVMAEIKDLGENGPTAAELGKVKEAQLRARETALRTNFFWISQLGSAYQYGDDPKDVLAYKAMVEGVTTDALRLAVRRYLAGENYVHVTLLPATVTP
jgi:zinc protease